MGLLSEGKDRAAAMNFDVMSGKIGKGWCLRGEIGLAHFEKLGNGSPYVVSQGLAGRLPGG